MIYVNIDYSEIFCQLLQPVQYLLHICYQLLILGCKIATLKSKNIQIRLMYKVEELLNNSWQS